MSLASQVLDYYDDIDNTLTAKLASAADVRHVPMRELSSGEHSSLDDSQFGLIVLTKNASVLRRFPVNDPGNAWLSAQYFQSTHSKLAAPARFVAAKFIKEACDAYSVKASTAVDTYAQKAGDSISNNLFQEGSESSWMLQKMAENELLTKQASAVEMNAILEMPDNHFALVYNTGDGETIRKYAMPDASHVQKAVTYFDKYAMQMAPAHRHAYARSVQRRASELNVPLENTTNIEKWASTRWNSKVDYHLEQRKSLLPRNPDACRTLDKLAAMFADTDPETAAEALSTFDQAADLERYYDRGLEDPYSSTMSKTAMGWSAEVDGETMTEAQLQKVAEGKKLRGYMGASFCDQFQKNASTIFESLPDTHKVLIKQIAFGEV